MATRLLIHTIRPHRYTPPYARALRFPRALGNSLHATRRALGFPGRESAHHHTLTISFSHRTPSPFHSSPEFAPISNLIMMHLLVMRHPPVLPHLRVTHRSLSIARISLNPFPRMNPLTMRNPPGNDTNYDCNTICVLGLFRVNIVSKNTSLPHVSTFGHTVQKRF